MNRELSGCHACTSTRWASQRGSAASPRSSRKIFVVGKNRAPAADYTPGGWFLLIVGILQLRRRRCTSGHKARPRHHPGAAERCSTIAFLVAFPTFLDHDHALCGRHLRADRPGRAERLTPSAAGPLVQPARTARLITFAGSA